MIERPVCLLFEGDPRPKSADEVIALDGGTIVVTNDAHWPRALIGAHWVLLFPNALLDLVRSARTYAEAAQRLALHGQWLQASNAAASRS